MERILSAPGQRVRMKRFGLYFLCPAVCVGSPISWAPGCQMLTWELSSTSSFPLTPSPSSQENGGVGWRQGASSGLIPPETCLSYSVGDSLFKGTHVCVREPCFVHSIKFFFSPPPDGELFILGPEIFRRHKRRGCHAWPTVTPVGWELRGQTCAAVGCVAQNPGRGHCGGWCSDRLG